MRSYLIDGNGQDHTVAIGIDDWWIADFASYIYREPATLFLELLKKVFSYRFPMKMNRTY